MHHTRINCLITRDIQNNFVELNVTRDETVDTRVKHFPEQPSSPDGNHTLGIHLTTFFLLSKKNFHRAGDNTRTLFDEWFSSSCSSLEG